MDAEIFSPVAIGQEQIFKDRSSRSECKDCILRSQKVSLKLVNDLRLRTWGTK
ncbi:hypothetical protein SLEP1_g46167 [Rubroshorea leprosula]|uniref:Uncharacterized protein n=1 Tax=Rubroshorea leprosula TaxID=152421 RepID=A0AAV5LNA6_9ROSI|nr:hypothetical protein SLEP1_g46167 [Rubroshorea leprosula]